MRPSTPAALAVVALFALGGCSGGGSTGDTDAVTSAPPVVAVEPASGSERLSTSTVFRVRFAAPVDETTIGGRVHVRSGGHELNARVLVIDGGSSLAVDPAERLPRDAAIRLALDPGLGTQDGTVLGRRIELGFRTDSAGAQSAVVAFDPLGGEIRPWPSDLFIAADPSRPGGRRIDVWNRSVPSFIGIEREGETDGFDLSSRMMIAFSEALDPASLTPNDGSAEPTASILLAVADPAAPGFGVPIPFLARIEPIGPLLAPPSHTLMIRALAPLAPDTRHALVVTRRVRGAGGGEAAPSDTLAALLAGRPAGDARVEDYGALLRDTVEGLGVVLPFGAEDVAGVTVFTTATESALTSRLVSLIDAEVKTAAARPPSFRVLRTETRGDEVIVHGRMTAYEFRGPNGRLDPARFATVPVTAPSVEIDVLVSLPKSARRAPVVIYGHGINAARDQLLGFSDSFARQGLASAAIDFVQHGSRFTGLIIPALSFLNIGDLPEAKDSARQTVADLVQLERTLATDLGGLDLLPLGAPDGVPDIDGARVAYEGESFGAILGSIFVAVAPALKGAALLIGGGTWTDVAVEELPLQPGYSGYETLVALAELLRLPAGEVYTYIALAQNAMSPGDALVYARRILRDRLPGSAPPFPVLQLEVIDDDVVPNAANESLARAIGLPLLTPSHRPVVGVATLPYPARGNGPDGLTTGLVQYRTFLGGTVATHTGVAGATDCHDHMAEFLAQALAGTTPTIEPPPADR